MVYFYGGSFEEGWSGLPDYDGGNLASRGDVILVTVNYRVGILGFLTTQTAFPGNQGLQDQILALEWIQQHM
jgi:acetylcholinesterase